MRKLLLLSLCMMIMGCVGCGMPLYPKVQMSLNPVTGHWTYSSAQETDLVVGSVEASASPDGTKTLRVGTDTQPAVVYGTQAVGVMEQYAIQQEKYTQMLDVIGKNAVLQIGAIGDAGGKILGGLLSLKSAGLSLGGVTGGAICNTCDALIPQVEDVVTKARNAKTILDQLQGK